MAGNEKILHLPPSKARLTPLRLDFDPRVEVPFLLLKYLLWAWCHCGICRRGPLAEAGSVAHSAGCCGGRVVAQRQCGDGVLMDG